MLPFVLRRQKSEVLADLPPKIITEMLCDLTPEQRRLHSLWERGGTSFSRLRCCTGFIADTNRPSRCAAALGPLVRQMAFVCVCRSCCHLEVVEGWKLVRSIDRAARMIEGFARDAFILLSSLWCLRSTALLIQPCELRSVELNRQTVFSGAAVVATPLIQSIEAHSSSRPTFNKT